MLHADVFFLFTPTRALCLLFCLIAFCDRDAKLLKKASTWIFVFSFETRPGYQLLLCFLPQDTCFLNVFSWKKLTTETPDFYDIGSLGNKRNAWATDGSCARVWSHLMSVWSIVFLHDQVFSKNWCDHRCCAWLFYTSCIMCCEFTKEPFWVPRLRPCAEADVDIFVLCVMFADVSPGSSLPLFRLFSKWPQDCPLLSSSVFPAIGKRFCHLHQKHFFFFNSRTSDEIGCCHHWYKISPDTENRFHMRLQPLLIFARNDCISWQKLQAFRKKTSDIYISILQKAQSKNALRKHDFRAILWNVPKN